MVDLVWNFEPNWTQDVRESLSWLSTISGSPSGVEQRMALRSSPRRRLEYGVLLTGPDRSYFNSALASAGANTWLLPLWFDAVVLTTPLASGSTEITFATAFREFVAGGKALLRRSLRTYEVVEIATVVSNKITLTAPTIVTWPAGTVLYPLRSARLDSDPTLSRHADRTETPAVALQTLEENPWSTSLSVLATYQGYPVLEQVPDEQDTLQTSIVRILEDLDPSIGLPAYYNTAGAALRVQQHTWLLRGLSENAVFRAFLYACKGRVKALWLPSFQADFDLAASVGSADTTIEVAHCGYTEFSGPGTDNRKDIRISLRDGTSIFRRITASVDNGETETLTLSSALGRSVSSSDIHRIEIMALCRLDSDTIEIAHHTDSSGASTASVSFRSHLSGRSASPWSPLPPGDTDPGDENTPPDPIGTANVIARLFTSATFDAQYEDNMYPIQVDDDVFMAPETNITFATGARLQFGGDTSAEAVLFLELIATDDNLVPLPADEQPTEWTVDASLTTVKGPVDITTFTLYGPSYSPIYAGVRMQWPASS